jgi:hypothetical protein
MRTSRDAPRRRVCADGDRFHDATVKTMETLSVRDQLQGSGFRHRRAGSLVAGLSCPFRESEIETWAAPIAPAARPSIRP